MVTSVVSAKVRGNAKNYSYFIAKLYEVRKSKNGHNYFYPTKQAWKARRSLKLAIQDAKDMAIEYNCEYREGVRYGTKA